NHSRLRIAARDRGTATCPGGSALPFREGARSLRFRRDRRTGARDAPVDIRRRDGPLPFRNIGSPPSTLPFAIADGSAGRQEETGASMPREPAIACRLQPASLRSAGGAAAGDGPAREAGGVPVHISPAHVITGRS